MPDTFTGMFPGANPGGGNIVVPGSSGSAASPAIGGSSNPFLPPTVGANAGLPITYPTGLDYGSAAPLVTGGVGPGGSPTSQSSFANTLGFGGVPGTQVFPQGSNVPGFPGGVGTSWAPSQQDFIKAMRKAGFSAGDAGMLYNFLASGAGFNPQIAQAVFAGMGPSIQRGEADILEQFGGMGLRYGSPASIGMGDYLSQVYLEQGQIMAGIAEQAIQNYMTVLLGGKGPAPQSTFQNIMQGILTLSTAAKSGGGG